MAQFDVAAALRDGHSIEAIAEFLGKEKKFDVGAAIADGHNPWSIIQELNKPEPGLGTLFSRGVARSVGELGVTAGDVLPALVAGAVLPDEKARPFVERQLKEAAATREELEKKYPTKFKSYKDVEDIGTGAGYVAERVGELIPDVGPSLGFGLVGRYAGKRMAREAAEKTAKEMAEKTEMELLEGGAENLAERTAYKNVADRVGRDAAEKLSREAANKGMNAGVFFGSYTQNAPEIFENIYKETGDIGSSGALLFGGLSSYLDSYLPSKLLTDFGAYGKSKIMAEMLKDSGAKPAVWKSVLAEGTKAAVGEGLTEAGQEAVSVAAEKFYGSNKELFGKEAVDRYLESFFAGAAGGGVLGGVSGISRGMQEKAIARGETGVDPIAVQNIEQVSEAEAQSRLTEPALLTPEQQQQKQELLLLGYTPQQADAAISKPAELAKGATDVDRPKQTTTGEGVILLGGPKTDTTTTGSATPSDGGVDVTDTGTARIGTGEEVSAGALAKGEVFRKPPPGPEGEQLVAVKERIDAFRTEFNALQQANTKLLGKQYVNAEDVLKSIQDGEINVDPAPFQKEVELNKQLQASYQEYSQLVGKLTKEKTEAEESTGAFTYMPGQVAAGPITETTETGEVVPTGPSERLVIQEDGTYGPAPAEMTGTQYAYTIDKETKKIVKVDKDGKIEPLKSTKETSQALSAVDALYLPLAKNFNATATGKDKIPGSFKSLPPDLRQAFLRPIAVGFSPETSFKQFLEYKNAFVPLKKGKKESEKFFGELTKQQKINQKTFLEEYGDIYDLAPKPFSKKKTTAESLKREALELRTTEELSRQRAVREAEVEKSLAEQPVGKGENVDVSVITALRNGDIDGALEALFNTAKDLKTMPGSATLVRSVAASLRNIGLQTKIEFGQILSSDRLAEYDPAVDKVRVNKDAVLDEATLLHELSHAGTVRVLYLYETGKADQLTRDQIKAVQQLYTMMDYAKKRIVLPQYEKAFENIYEFVSYAVTDPRFQAELAKYKSPIVKDRSLWSMIADAIGRIFGLDEGQGTLATDIADAFGEILSAPDPDQRIDLAALPITAPPSPAPKMSSEEKIKSVRKERLQKMEDLKPGLAQVSKGVKKLFTKSGLIEAERKLQNERAYLRRLQQNLSDTRRLKSVGENKNNIYTAITLSAGESKTIHQKYLYTNILEAQDILAALTKAYNKSVEVVLDLLHDYVIVMHDPERRRIKFLREAPLVSDGAKDRRDDITQEILAIDPKIPSDATPEQAKALTDQAVQKAKDLRAELEQLVAKNLDTSSEFSNESHDKYNTLGKYSYEDIKKLRDDFRKDPNNGLVFAYLDKMKEIQETTMFLNKEANYLSQPVQNLINFYGFKNYFSFKGKPDSKPNDYQVDPMHPKTSGELQEMQYAMEGRISESDNPLLNTINEATRAAMRLGRKDVTLTLKNLAEYDEKLNPDGQSILKHVRVIKNISFKDRFNENYDSDLRRKNNTVFHYKEDGSIDIIEINDKDLLYAIKRPFQESNPLLDIANKITSGVGQLHTRYNPSFAAVDFTRNSFMYSGIVSSEFGLKAGGEVLKEIANVVASGGMNKVRKFSLAFANGDTKVMEKLMAQDDFYKTIGNYFIKGGRVSYIQGLSYKDNLIEGVRGVKSSGIIQSKEKIDKFLDSWLDMFELSTRIGAYKVVRDQYIAQGMSPEAADVEAIAFAKNLANFEQTGEWGKTMGAFFMFFRPAATGAVRAIQAIAPAFDFSTDTEILDRYKSQVEFGEITDEQAATALAKFKERRDNARITALALLGMGATAYAMAVMLTGEDEEDRNKTITDDMARWVRFARWNTGIKVAGQDLVLQTPWGYGTGALASAGAQVMAVAFGGQGVMDAINNIMDATFESFMPLPTSKINKFEHPTQWAVDTVTPSVLRPLVEFAMNIDGLGREIYNNRQSRYNDAYTGGDNIPLAFKDAAEYIYNTLGVDVSPNSLYFFANNYLDGVSRMAATTWGIGNAMVGRKDFDPRTDTIFLDAYIKGPSNYDAKQFGKVEDKIKDMERDYKSLEGTDMFADYIDKNPNAKGVIDFYNSYVNGALRDLRADANRIRRDQSMSPQEKKDQIRLIVENQNRIKAAFVNAVKGYDIEP